MTSSRFIPYPDTKDSGIEWLGQIPTHWDRSRLSAWARTGYKTFTDGDWVESPFITDEGIRLVQTGNIGTGAYREQGFRYISENSFDELGCTEVLPGDVLICRLADPVGRACLAPDLGVRMITSVDVAILKPRTKTQARYLVHLLSSAPYLSWMSAVCRGGTRDRVSRSFLGGVRVPVPLRDEQQAIADFLDRETAKIDALVEKKEQLVELLQEKRTALITHAVTKGLDPEAPMKDSGIEWLGQIPTHWVETRLGWSVEVNGGHTPDTGELRYWDGEIPWVTPKDMKRRVITDSLDHVSEEALAETSLRLLATGNVLIVVRGMILAHTFPVAVLRAPATINQDMKALLPTDGLESDYLAYLLEGISEFILSLVEESAHGTRRLQTELWKRVQLFLPPAIEQARIIEHLDSEIAKIDALIAKVEEAIERLKEYRIALISAATTGKIDVRVL